MEAKELMIGDWVNVFGIPKQMEGIREFRNGDEVVYYDGDNGNFIENVTPIPLTPEILEKNGFIDASGKKLKYEYESFNKDVQLNYLTKYSVFSIYIKNEKDNYLWGLIRPNEWYKAFEGEINYIHELQHALRLCGIDKEIIL